LKDRDSIAQLVALKMQILAARAEMEAERANREFFYSVERFKFINY